MILSFLIYLIKLLVIILLVSAFCYVMLDWSGFFPWEEHYTDLVEWPYMFIEDSKIVTEYSSYSIGMPYEEVKHLLSTDDIVINEDMVTSKSGCIVIKRIEFYEFKGTCTIYFCDGCINRILIESVIDEKDLPRGSKGHIQNMNSFKSANYEECVMYLDWFFGKPFITAVQKNRIYKAGNLTISVSATGLSHDSDPDICDYSITIW